MKKIKIYFVAALCLVACILLGGPNIKVHAANPYLPLWEHVPDGEPYVFEDPANPGRYRVYIYGSHDTRKTDYCGEDLVVWSAPVDDLDNWRYDGVIFQSIVNGTADILYAPCVAEVKGSDGKKTYYLYPNNQSSGRKGMIAKSNSPIGPFTVCNWVSGSTTNTTGIVGFDPAVFVDSDGRVYGYWGFQSSSAAELDPNTMCTVKSGTSINTNMIGSCNATDDNDFRFFEASSIRKVNNKYVFVYSRKTKTGEFGLSASNDTLAYAYSDNPLGPWTYGGTIIDARGRSTGANGEVITTQPWGNTHGSIIQINGQWYIFYHRLTSSIYARQGTAEPIDVSVTSDGKVVIKEAEMTSQGFGLNGLNPSVNRSAGYACYLTGGPNVSATYDQGVNEAPVVNIKNNSVVGFKYFNFDWMNGAGTKLQMDITPKGVAGTVDIMMDSPWTSRGGTKLGTLSISATSPKVATKMTVATPALDNVNGKHAIYFVFKSTSTNQICDFNDLVFLQSSSLAVNNFTYGFNNINIVNKKVNNIVLSRLGLNSLLKNLL